MSTGSLMTRQTYDRAPRLTKLATAHISKGAHDIVSDRFFFIFITKRADT